MNQSFRLYNHPQQYHHHHHQHYHHLSSLLEFVFVVVSDCVCVFCTCSFDKKRAQTCLILVM